MRRRPPALLIAAALLLAGCGSRVDESEVRAGAQPAGPVTLDPAALETLRAASGSLSASAGTATPGAALAPGAPGAPSTPAAPGAIPSSLTPRAPQQSRTSGAAVAARPADTGRCTAQGAPAALGQVGTFSGLAGPIAGDGLAAMAVWAKDVNARGGLACHPVTIYVRDDGGDPAQAASATRELIATRGVVAFVGNILPLSMAGFLPEIKKNGCVPAVGALAGDSLWNTDSCLFNPGGGFDEAIAGLVRQAVDRGHTKLGLLYCVEIAGCAYADKGVAAAANREGADLVYSAQVSLTQTDFTAQCQNAKNAGVQELAAALEGSALARLARSCLALNYRPLLVGAAFAINPRQAGDPKIRELGLATINPNAPWFLTDQPGLREYQAALARYAPQILSSGITSQMWASGRLLEAGIAKAGAAARQGPLTAAMVAAGLSRIRGETLGGLSAPLDFTGKIGRGSGCVYLALLDTRGWTAPNGSKPLCNLLPKGTR
jgi:branched-chain amino acid transport system substrate-binding protein